MASENVTINLTQDIMSGSLPESCNKRPEILTYFGENKFCPLCRSPIRLFFINLHDKLLMCENQACEFPFGHEKLRIITPGEISVVESFCVSDRIRSTPITSHVKSGNASSERDNMKEVLDDVQLPSPKAHSTNIQEKCKAKPEAEEEQIMRNIEDIREMNVELLSLKDEWSEEKPKEEDCRISNEKWIKNLKSLQEMSGVQLLRPDEMGLLKKEEPVIGLGELKIDIGPGNVSDVPSIRIEIHNTDQDNSKDDEPIKPDKPKG